MKNIIILSCKEMLNKRILHIGIVLSLIYVGIYGIGLHLIMKENPGQVWWIQEFGYQFLTLGWYFSSFLVGALAIMAGSVSLSHEIENGTILGLASKPLSRRSILLGKYIAYAIVIGLYTAVITAAIAGLVVTYTGLMVEIRALIMAIVLFISYPLIVLSVAQLFSSCMSTLAASISTFILFSIGIIGGFIEQMGAIVDNSGMINLGIISSLIIPSDAIYRMVVSLVGGTAGQGIIAKLGPFGSASVPSFWMLIYAFLYVLFMLFLAIRCFEKRDL